MNSHKMNLEIFLFLFIMKLINEKLTKYKSKFVKIYIP